MKQKKLIEKNHSTTVLVGLVLLEVVVFFLLFFSAILPYSDSVMAVVGSNNVTVRTLLTIGNVYPEVFNVTINNGAASIDLSPNATVIVVVNLTARDFNGEGDIANVTAEFFDVSSSSYGAADDNNRHYTNNTCAVNYTYGDSYEISALCTFFVWYYANNATWNSTVRVTDNNSLIANAGDLINVNTLLALALPDSIDYGTVNASAVSSQRIANVTNAGNVLVNLSLNGYGGTSGDNFAMNCTLGALRNISIGYEKYNLTYSNTSTLSLAEFEARYKNLTSSVNINTFNLLQRQNDTASFLDDTNATYWRIYVPIGVAGSCTGNIIFGAVQAAGS